MRSPAAQKEGHPLIRLSTQAGNAPTRDNHTLSRQGARADEHHRMLGSELRDADRHRIRRCEIAARLGKLRESILNVDSVYLHRPLGAGDFVTQVRRTDNA